MQENAPSALSPPKNREKNVFLDARPKFVGSVRSNESSVRRCMALTYQRARLCCASLVPLDLSDMRCVSFVRRCN